MSGDVDCECHCGGEFHGIGNDENGGRPSGYVEVEGKRKFLIGYDRKTGQPVYESQPLERPKVRERLAKLVKAKPKPLREMTDDELAGALGAVDWSDLEAVRTLSREASRRDKNERERGKRRSESVAHANDLERQYLAAEEETRGHMLSRAGQAKNIDPKSLWEGSETRARKYASEELNEYWDAHPRLTIGKVREDARKNRAAEEDAYEAEHGPYSHIYGPPIEPGWSELRRQDFDSSIPLSLIDESTINAAQPMKSKTDSMGTADMFG